MVHLSTSPAHSLSHIAGFLFWTRAAAHLACSVCPPSCLRRDLDCPSLQDKLVSQALSERSSELPERIQTLIKECVSSSSVVEIDNLKAEVRRKQDAIDQLRQSRGENTDGNVPLSERAAAMPHTRSSSKPWDDHEGPLESPVGRTARKVGGGAAKGSSEALSAARGEIERLQKLFNAGEVVREGLERRIGELEGEVHRLRARAAGDPNSPAKGQEASKSLEDEGENGELYTKDGRDFENYIRRLAGLSELPPGDKADRANQRVRVGLGPKPTSKAGVVAEQSKGNREWVVYEVTTQTGKVAGGGTSAECYVTFRGEHGDYGPCQLEKAEGGGGVLSEGAKDVFDVCALDVGVLKAIIVSHDNTGESPSWNLLAVTVSLVMFPSLACVALKCPLPTVNDSSTTRVCGADVPAAVHLGAKGKDRLAGGQDL